MSKLPENLKDCMNLLDQVVSEKDKNEIIKSSEDEFTMHAHFGMGLWIRNNWIYNDKCRINEIFPWHVQDDDKSTIILKAYWRHLRGIDYNNLIDKKPQ